MKSIYENVSEDETTVPIICSELNFNKYLVGKIIKRLGLIELRKEFINKGMTKVYSKYPLYSECERYSKLSYVERLNEGRIRNFGNLENFYTIRSKHTKDTNLKKYGVENVFQSEQIKEKIKQINIEKYGTETKAYSDFTRKILQQADINISDIFIEAKKGNTSGKIIDGLIVVPALIS